MLLSFVTTSTTVELNDVVPPGVVISPERTYDIYVRPICPNGCVSPNAAFLRVPGIIIEDLVMMHEPCIQAGCNTPPTLITHDIEEDGSGGYFYEFPLHSTNMELFYIEMDCSVSPGDSHFYLQSEMSGGIRTINVPSKCKDFGANCTNCRPGGSYQIVSPPRKITYNTLEGTGTSGDDYTVTIYNSNVRIQFNNTGSCKTSYANSLKVYRWICL